MLHELINKNTAYVGGREVRSGSRDLMDVGGEHGDKGSLSVALLGGAVVWEEAH